MEQTYEIHWTRHRLLRAYKFMKLLRVEPYLFMMMFQMSLKGTPSSQLLQDKICMHWYPDTTAQYCRDLPSAHESDEHPGHYKSRILADVAQFGTYSTYLSTVPALVWTLFVGAWIDRYVRGRKFLMLMSVGASIVEIFITIFLSIKFETSVYYNLLLHIPTSLFGGHIASRIAITHYISSTTPPKLMAIRFMIFEMCMFVASPIGSSLGGYILVQKPVFHGGEIRNYTMCFIIALGFEVLAFLWIIFMINEEVARKQEMKIEMKIRGMKSKGKNEGAKIKLRSDMSVEDSRIHPLRLLFDLGNVKTMVKTVLKKRPNKARKQLFLLFISMIVMVMAFQGGGHVTGQFIQRVYYWQPDWTSYMNSISMVIHSIATVSIVPFLIKGLKVADIQLAIIGYTIGFISNVIKGTIMSPVAYYITMGVGSISGVSMIGTRSHLTKIVGRDEIGKVMSFMSALDTLAPMISSTVFTYIFKATIDTYPGTVYQVTALLSLIPIYVMMWIDLFTERPLVEGHRHHHRKNDQDENQNNDEQDDISGRKSEKHHDHLHVYHKKHRKHEKKVEQDNIPPSMSTSL